MYIILALCVLMLGKDNEIIETTKLFNKKKKSVPFGTLNSPTTPTTMFLLVFIVVKFVNYPLIL